MRRRRKLEVCTTVPDVVPLSELEGSAEVIARTFKDVERQLISESGAVDKDRTRVRFTIGGDCESTMIDAVVTRLETDKEYEKRLKREAEARMKADAAKAENETAQRELYERLKKKFEK